MRYLCALQVALGIVKIVSAFTFARNRQTWHLISGVAIVVMGLVMMNDIP